MDAKISRSLREVGEDFGNCLPNSEGGGRPFKFMNFIADQSQFQNLVQTVWRKPVVGHNTYKV